MTGSGVFRCVSGLTRAYQTDEKVPDTRQLCEELGVNTPLSDPFEKPVRLMQPDRAERGGRIQWLSEMPPPKPHHSDDYWSATPREQRVEFNVDSGSEHDHDNIRCVKPEVTP